MTAPAFAFPHSPSRTTRLLFVARAVRPFAYGFLSVVLVLYLVETAAMRARRGAWLPKTRQVDLPEHLSGQSWQVGLAIIGKHFEFRAICR